MSSLDEVPHKRTREAGAASRAYSAPAVAVDYSSGRGEVTLRGGLVGVGACLGCYDTPCMVAVPPRFSVQSRLRNFPGDMATDVCPSDAIHLHMSSGLAEVEATKCIGCGLCAARCPYGAISMTAEGTAVVQSDDPSGLTVEAPNTPVVHPKVRRKSPIGVWSPKLQGVTDVVGMLPSAQAAQFVRNVLCACGVPSLMSRKGDQNVRMDGVFELESGTLGPIEIGLGTETLEPLRSLIEDVAVLHGRYNARVSQLIPIAVLLTLPSARSEYYRLVTDLKDVTGVRFRTTTLGVLLSLMWQFRILESFDDDILFVDQNQLNLWEPLRSRWPTLIQLELRRGAYTPSR